MAKNNSEWNIKAQSIYKSKYFISLLIKLSMEKCQRTPELLDWQLRSETDFFTSTLHRYIKVFLLVGI